MGAGHEWPGSINSIGESVKEGSFSLKNVMKRRLKMGGIGDHRGVTTLCLWDSEGGGKKSSCLSLPS